MRILGISAYYHDSAAALIEDGRIVAAAQEERFTRKKHDSAFPINAINYCLSAAKLKANNLSDALDWVAFYDKPFLKFERLLETYLAFAPKGFSSFKTSMPIWFKEKLFQKNLLIKEFKKIDPQFALDSKLLFSEHHLSHAASAFFASPFERAAVLTMDGVGEWATTSLAIGNGNSLEVQKEIHFPHSLGLLYSAFTYYTGFKVNSGEYKVMGLAPYGVPRFVEKIYDHLIDVKADGSFRLNQEYFDYCTGLTMINTKFEKIFGLPTRQSHEPLTQDHMDLAASIQKVTEDIVLKLAADIAKTTQEKNLCLAGGVALNCVANGKVLRSGYFEKLWIQPAAGDAGGALGAALAAYYLNQKQPRKLKGGHDLMDGSYLGPEFDQADIENRLQQCGARFKTYSEEDFLDQCAHLLSQEKAMGWFSGRMEFGPRALGARSIIADARSKTMQSVLNLKVKYRESFRPFAPSVLKEEVAQWFELDQESPYMLLVADVKNQKRIAMTAEQQKLFGIAKLNVPRSAIPSVTHVDYSARIQTVDAQTNQRYYDLIKKFFKITGCPVVVNTSFNVRGEPIVCTPEDAFRCFMGTEIEVLAIGRSILLKDQQDQQLLQNYKDKFELD